VSYTCQRINNISVKIIQKNLQVLFQNLRLSWIIASGLSYLWHNLCIYCFLHVLTFSAKESYTLLFYWLHAVHLSLLQWLIVSMSFKCKVTCETLQSLDYASLVFTRIHYEFLFLPLNMVIRYLTCTTEVSVCQIHFMTQLPHPANSCSAFRRCSESAYLL
jgi:hypothetical protein